MCDRSSTPIVVPSRFRSRELRHTHILRAPQKAHRIDLRCSNIICISVYDVKRHLRVKFLHLGFCCCCSLFRSCWCSFLQFSVVSAVVVVMEVVVLVLRVCRVPVSQNAHWHVSVCSKRYRALLSSQKSFQHRVSHCPFGDCPQSFVLVFCRPLIHLPNYLFSYCLMSVNTISPCTATCDANPIQKYFANYVEVVLRVSQLFLQVSIFPPGSNLA